MGLPPVVVVVAKDNLRSDALHDTTVISRESSTIVLDWKAHALPITSCPHHEQIELA